MTLKEDADDLEGMITALKRRISEVRTDMTNDRVWSQAVECERKAIELHQKRLDRLIDNRENGDQIIEECEKQIKSLRRRFKSIVNHKKIEQLKKLLAEVNKLES